MGLNFFILLRNRDSESKGFGRVVVILMVRGGGAGGVARASDWPKG
jgi:hypothetical protein